MPSSNDYYDGSFGEGGFVAYRHNGPRRPNGWSSHVLTLPNGRDLVCVGAVPQNHRPGAPMSLVCLLLSGHGQALNVTLHLPEAGAVADVAGAMFVGDSEWLVVAGNTTHLMRPFLCRINVRTGAHDTAFESHFNTYIRDGRAQGGGFRLDGVLIDGDESVLLSGSLLRQTRAGAVAFVIRLHPDGSPRSVVAASSSARDEQLRWVSAMAFTDSGRIAAVAAIQSGKRAPLAGMLFVNPSSDDPAHPPGVPCHLSYIHDCSWYDGETVMAVGSVTKDGAQHAAVVTVGPQGELRPAFSMAAADSDFRAACVLAEGSVLLVGNSAGTPVVARFDEDGDWEPTFPGQGFAVLPLEIPATDVALVGGRVVINHCSDHVDGGAGLVLSAVPLVAPRRQPTRPAQSLRPQNRPGLTPASARPRRSDPSNPYTGMSEAAMSAVAKADHLQRMADLRVDATLGLRNMGW